MVNSTQNHIPEGSDKRTFLDRMGSPGEIRVALLLSVMIIGCTLLYCTKINGTLDSSIRSSSTVSLSNSIRLEDVLKITGIIVLSNLSNNNRVEYTLVPGNVADQVFLNFLEGAQRSKDLRGGY